MTEQAQAEARRAQIEALMDRTLSIFKESDGDLEDAIYALLDELDRLSRVEQALRWQPIETAPKDGTTIIGALIRDSRIWRVHEMKHNGLAFYTSSGGSLPQMTHWIPLPASPEAQPEEGR